MKILVIYESYFGNTHKIAEQISKSFRKEDTVKLVNAQDFNTSMLKDTELLIVGSPTRMFNYTENTKSILNSFNRKSLRNIYIASFDTRADIKKRNSKLLNILVNLSGYAAEKINKKLIHKGGKEISTTQWFYVKDTEGPLEDNELEKATEWAKDVISSI